MASDNRVAKTILLELAFALALGLLAGAPSWSHFPSTLDEGTYAQALRFAQGAPANPAEILTRALWGFVSPIIGSASFSSLGVFYLALPVLLMLASAVFAYAALRFWGFGRLESGACALLFMVSAPVSLALYPGFMPVPALALPLSLLGLAALALSASWKEYSLPSSLLALIAFSFAAWVEPWSALLPLSLLAGEMVRSHRALGELVKSQETLVRLLVLALPALVALIAAPLPAYSLTSDGVLKFLYNSRLLIGLAVLPIPLLWAAKKHPQAPVYASLLIVALLAGTVSPSGAFLLLLLPAAYGLHTLSSLDQNPKRTQAVLLCAAVFMLGMGLFADQSDPVRLVGLSAILSAIALVVFYLYRGSASLAKYGLLTFLLGLGFFSATTYYPGLSFAPPYAYQPLSPGADQALRWLASHEPAPVPDGSFAAPAYAVPSSATARVEVFAPDAAVRLATNRSLASNDTAFVRWLASANMTPRPFSRGDYVIADSLMFERIQSNSSILDRSWTLIPLQYARQSVSGSTTFATFVSSQGYAIMQAIDPNMMPTSDSAILFDPGQYNYPNEMVRGDVGLMMPGQGANASGQLLLWYNREYNSNAVRIYAQNSTFEQIYSKDGTTVFKVIS